MKKRRLVLIYYISLFLFCFKTLAFCQDKANISITPEIGFINGKIVENVWYAKGTITQNKITITPTDSMSRLDWQIKNSFYFGLSFDLCINDFLDFSFGFKNANSYNCGIMEDYDWLNPLYWPDDNKDEITNYSIHTNYLDNYLCFNFLFGLKYFLDKNKNISLTPRFGLEFENFSFAGIGGWKKYKSNNWAKEKFVNEKIITYSQTYFAPVLSLEADFNYAKHFETMLNINVLWIKKIDCIDHHPLKNIDYNDRIQNAWKFGANLCMYYKINQKHKVGIKGSVSYIPKAYGLTYSSTTDTTPDTSSLGGTSRFLWTYGFVYTFYF